MIARFEEATLWVTSSPLTIVLDGAHWGPRQAAIASTLLSEARRRHVDARLVFWGDDKLLQAVPLESYADEHSLGVRGRFITPLVEGDLLGTGSLVCFVDGWVPDWDDWTSELELRFDPRVSVLLGPQAEALTDTWATTDSLGEIEPIERDLITRLFGVHVTSVSLHFEGCVPTSLAPRFVASDEAGRLCISWVGDEDSISLDLAPTSGGGACLVDARVGDSSGSIVTLQAELPVVRSGQPKWRRLEETESEGVRSTLSSYQAGNGEHDCPHCGRRHRFEQAFHCARSRFFGAASGLCPPRGADFRPGDRIAIRLVGTALEVAEVGPGSAVWLEDVVALRGADCWIVADRDGAIVNRLEGLWPALFGNGDGDLWMVET